jgi:hypothetical protein
MTVPIGFQCKLYRNTGTYASPTWTEITNVKDLEVPFAFSEADVSTRSGGGWREKMAGLLDAPVTFGMVYDPADTVYTALRTAAFARTTVEFAIADGAIATVGTHYLRARCQILGFTFNQPLEEGAMTDVSLFPTRNSDGAPAFVTVTE